MFSRRSLLVACSLVVGMMVSVISRPARSVSAADAKRRVFEIRTYTTAPGKLPDLLRRFRDHTTKLFEKHGMTNIGYWVPTDEPRSKDTLIYVLAHDSRASAEKSWKDFPVGPRMAESSQRVRSGRQNHRQSRVHFHRSHGLFGDQVMARVDSTRIESATYC
jgi:hypothetical protein